MPSPRSYASLSAAGPSSAAFDTAPLLFHDVLVESWDWSRRAVRDSAASSEAHRALARAWAQPHEESQPLVSTSYHWERLADSALQPRLAVAKPQLSVQRDAASSSRLSTEHLLRLISGGRVLEAMHLFETALQRISVPRLQHLASDARRNLSALDDLLGAEGLLRPAAIEAMILSIAAQAKRPICRGAVATRASWQPSHLPEQLDFSALGREHQSMFAIAALYDALLQLGFMPSSRIAALLIEIATPLLRTDKIEAFVDAQLRAAGGAIARGREESYSMPGERLDRGCFGLDAVEQAVLAYGRAQVPWRGEALLAWWSCRANDRSRYLAPIAIARFPAAAQSKNSLSAPDEITIAGWSSSPRIWVSLIAARAQSGDLSGAKVWLERYRALAKTSGAPPDSAPYEAFARACTGPALMPRFTGWRPRPREMEDETEEQVARDAEQEDVVPVAHARTLAMRAVLDAAVSDGIGISSRLGGLVISFEASCGRTHEAASLLVQLLDRALTPRPTTDATTRSSQQRTSLDWPLCIAVFRVYERLALASPGTTPTLAAFLPAAPASAAALRPFSTLRGVVRALAASHFELTRGNAKRHSMYSKPNMLLAALRAALLSCDFALARAVLQMHQAWHVAVAKTCKDEIRRAYAYHFWSGNSSLGDAHEAVLDSVGSEEGALSDTTGYSEEGASEGSVQQRFTVPAPSVQEVIAEPFSLLDELIVRQTVKDRCDDTAAAHELSSMSAEQRSELVEEALRGVCLDLGLSRDFAALSSGDATEAQPDLPCVKAA
jgi:hypothetical protein